MPTFDLVQGAVSITRNTSVPSMEVASNISPEFKNLDFIVIEIKKLFVL